MNKSILLIAALSCTALLSAADTPTIKVINGTGDLVGIDYQTAYGIEKKWKDITVRSGQDQVLRQGTSKVVAGKMVEAEPWNRANIKEIKYNVPSSYSAYFSTNIDFQNQYPGQSIEIVISATTGGYTYKVYREGSGETGKLMGQIFGQFHL